MARRWILTVVIAAVLVVAGVVAARAIRDDDSDADTAQRATTTSSAVTTTTAPASSTTASPATTAAPTSTTAPTNTTGPPGPCGTDSATIRAAVDAAVNGAAQSADVASCRLAASDPTWAAVNLAAKPGAQFAAVTVVVHRGAGSWTVVAQGGADAGCGDAPQQVIVDLGQFCAGTGGGAQ
ncbi:MAG TPA: hypothetical protein VGN51_15000 [Acidimicrobiia bacterium]|jgi:hypothetical protein